MKTRMKYKKEKLSNEPEIELNETKDELNKNKILEGKKLLWQS